ncbi:MAG: phenylacetate-CoA oxygenase subunit PaaJ [Chitinophagaceae bacterium]|nr:phenylacetate-CoA oxygenase subunit PaaJ [Chitinophagaceae bacterium]
MKTVSSEKAIWHLLESVSDPEIPVLSVIDLGIIRSVLFVRENNHDSSDHQLVITITPTYTGCPAMDMISKQISSKLEEAGYQNFEIKQTLKPAWTTDWMTETGKEKLRSYGIAAPVGKSFNNYDLSKLKIPCPQCGSENTSMISEFGSTSCKALFKCLNCKEPFDYFKCH